MNEKMQVLVDAIPVNEEISYETLRSNLLAQGQAGRDALSVFHKMRRKGEITVRLNNDGETVTLFVSRAS